MITAIIAIGYDPEMRANTKILKKESLRSSKSCPAEASRRFMSKLWPKKMDKRLKIFMSGDKW